MGKAYSTYTGIGPFVPGVTPPPAPYTGAPVDIDALCAELRESTRTQAAISDVTNGRLVALCELVVKALDRPAPVVNVPSMVPEIKILPAPVTPQPLQIETKPGVVEVLLPEDETALWPMIVLLVLVAAHLALAAWPMLRGV